MSEIGWLAAVPQWQLASVQVGIPSATAIQTAVARDKAATNPTCWNANKEGNKNSDQNAGLHAS